MIRLPGILKVMAILVLDFAAIHALFNNVTAALAVTGVISLYVWLGGYLILMKEKAISSKNLPSYEGVRLENAKAQLVEDVKNISAANISNLRIYLIPEDDDMNATAYGANCISVARGTLDNTDPVTLVAILGHEVSHILHYDAEFKRAIFASVTLLVGACSVMSAAAMVIILLLFLVLRCFRSWLGVLAFRGAAKATGGLFSVIQRSIVLLYHGILSLVGSHAEYRCDGYSCSLGYGIQLVHYLSMMAPHSQQKLTLSDALYYNHPPVKKRIERLEERMANNTNIKKRDLQ